MQMSGYICVQTALPQHLTAETAPVLVAHRGTVLMGPASRNPAASTADAEALHYGWLIPGAVTGERHTVVCRRYACQALLFHEEGAAISWPRPYATPKQVHATLA
jgi:hypothetical protein